MKQQRTKQKLNRKIVQRRVLVESGQPRNIKKQEISRNKSYMRNEIMMFVDDAGLTRPLALTMTI